MKCANRDTSGPAGPIVGPVGVLPMPDLRDIEWQVENAEDARTLYDLARALITRLRAAEAAITEAEERGRREGYARAMGEKRKVARWDASIGRYWLTPLHHYHGYPAGIMSTHSREDCIAWGYTVEGGPEPLPASHPVEQVERPPAEREGVDDRSDR